MEVKIQDKLYKDIVSYCSINNLDVKKYINDILKKSFMIEKYGEKPGVSSTKKETEPINEPNKQKTKNEVKVFPQLENVVIDFSTQEELKPEIPMSHDIPEEKVKEMLKEIVKPNKRIRKLS